MTRVLGRIVVAGLAACMLSACGFASVSPFVDGADVAYDPRLVGTWTDSAGKEWAVVSQEKDGYDVTYRDSDGKTGRFHAVLGRLGARRVLDVIPKDPGLGASDLYRSLLMPTHGIVVIERIDSLLTFRGIEADAVKKLLESQPSLVAHTLSDNTIVLTVPTRDARRFLSDIIDRPGILGEPESWRRRK